MSLKIVSWKYPPCSWPKLWPPSNILSSNPFSVLDSNGSIIDLVPFPATSVAGWISIAVIVTTVAEAGVNDSFPVFSRIPFWLGWPRKLKSLLSLFQKQPNTIFSSQFLVYMNMSSWLKKYVFWKKGTNTENILNV